MFNKRLFIPGFLLLFHFANAQTFVPNKNGYVNDPKFRQLMKMRGYGLMGSFDTLSVNPMIVIAPFQKNGKWGSIDNHGKVFEKPEAKDQYTSDIKGDKEPDSYSDSRLYKSNGKTEVPRTNIFSKYQKDGKYGTHDASGKDGIPAIYDLVSSYNDTIVYVRSGKQYGVFFADGRPIVPVDYDFVTFSYSKQVLFSVKKDKFYGVFSADGKMIIPVQYDKIAFDSRFKNLVKVTLNDKTALFTATGKQLTQFIYDQIYGFNNAGITIVKTGVGQDAKMGAIDTRGNIVLPAEYRDVSYFSPKLFKINTGKYPEQSWGLIDLQGKPVSQQDYSMIDGFEKGYSRVSRGLYPNKKMGFIDSTGNEVVKTNYTSVEGFNQAGFSVVKIDNKSGLINRKDEMIVQPVYDAIVPNIAKKVYVTQFEHKHGLLDMQGKVILPPTYDVMNAAKLYGYLVQLDKKQGMIDDDGKIIITIKYDKISPSAHYKMIEHGLVNAVLNGKKCVVDLYGNEYFEPSPVEKAVNFMPDADGYVSGPAFQQFIKERGFQLVSAFDTLERKPLAFAARVMLDGKWKVMDNKGQYIEQHDIPSFYQDVTVVPGLSSERSIEIPGVSENTGNTGFGQVITNGKSGTTNTKTNAIGLPAIYDGLVFMGQGWVMTELSEKYGMAMDDGRVMIAPKYESITPAVYNGKFTFAYFFVRDGGKYGVVTADGKELIPAKYDQLQSCEGATKSNNLLKFSLDKKWGLITKAGKVLLPPTYDGLNYYYHGLFKSVVGTSFPYKYGLIDTAGKVLLEPLYKNLELNYGKKIIHLTVQADLREKYGYATLDGKMLLKPVYDDIYDLKDGLFRVKLNGKYGLVTREEKFMIQPIYDELYVRAASRTVMVQLARKNGIVDLNGNKIIAPIYDELYPAKGNFVFELNGKWGIMSAKEKVLTTLDYESISAGYNCFVVRLHGKWGLMDADGKLITAIKYDRFQTASNAMNHGLAEITLNGRKGMIDHYGNEYFQY